MSRAPKNKQAAKPAEPVQEKAEATQAPIVEAQAAKPAEPVQEKAEDEAVALRDELRAIKKREAEIAARLRAIAEEKHLESSGVTIVDHQQAMHRASEELRKAGMIPGPGSRSRR